MNDSSPRSVIYEFGGFRLEPQHRVLAHADGRRIEIAAKAFDALLYLVEHAGTVVARDELMKALWPRTIVEDNSLNKLIAAMRRALGDEEYVATLPGRGYQFVADVRVSPAQVEAAKSQVAEPGAELATPPRVRWQWIAAIALAVAIAALGAWSLKPEAPSQSGTLTGVIRFRVGVVPGQHLYGGVPLEIDPLARQRPSRPAFALSPDGRYLVYAATDGETSRLYKRRMDEQESTLIPGTEGGTQPSFSPDSLFVAFFAGNQLKRVPTDGGDVRTITISGFPPIPDSTVSWTENDTLVVTANDGSIYEVPANGGEATRLTLRHETEFTHRYAQMLPNRRGLLLNVVQMDEATRPSEWDIVVQPLDGNERRVVVAAGSRPVYVPSGHILFARSGQLWAVPFDPIRLETTGAPVVIVEDVMHADRAFNGLLNSGAAQFSVSRTGALAYVTGGIYPKAADLLVWLDANGASESLPLPPDRYLWPRFSPDGTKIVYGTGTLGDLRLWVYDIALAVRQPLTTTGEHLAPVWSPDGRRIAFSRLVGGIAWVGLFTVAADGSEQLQRIAGIDGIQGAHASSWSIDNRLAFVGTPAETRSALGGVWTLRIDGISHPERFGSTESQALAPDFSPDGKWIAYTSQERSPAGEYTRPEIYVRQFPDSGPEYQISSDGGDSPLWSRDGRQLFYVFRAGPGEPLRVMVVDVATDPTFTRGKPRLLFEGPYAGCGPARCYDVSPDGKRFVAVRLAPAEPQPVTGINIVLNWFEELSERVPVQQQ
jgi:serine/threonine-protein kinase